MSYNSSCWKPADGAAAVRGWSEKKLYTQFINGYRDPAVQSSDNNSVTRFFEFRARRPKKLRATEYLIRSCNIIDSVLPDNESVIFFFGSDYKGKRHIFEPEDKRINDDDDNNKFAREKTYGMLLLRGWWEQHLGLRRRLAKVYTMIPFTRKLWWFESHLYFTFSALHFEKSSKMANFHYSEWSHCL